MGTMKNPDVSLTRGLPCRGGDGCTFLFAVNGDGTDMATAITLRNAHEVDVHGHDHPPPPITHQHMAPFNGTRRARGSA